MEPSGGAGGVGGAGEAGTAAMRQWQSRTLFLCGDVMTGRGIDQILPHPCDPRLHEPYARSARDYVALAERAHGAIPEPVAFEYVWGDALAELDRVRPDARIVNLETAVTTSEAFWPDKGIHYRMHPRHVPCLTTAGIDCCVLANNHVLDWGYPGLHETLAALVGAGLAVAGAGRDLEEAQAPAVLPTSGSGSVLVFASGCESSGATVSDGAVWVWIGFRKGNAVDVVSVTIVNAAGATAGEGSVSLSIICDDTCNGWLRFRFGSLEPGNYGIRVARNGLPAAEASFTVLN